MSGVIDAQLLDYYLHYCELTIWLKKIVLQSHTRQSITIKDIAAEFIAERNKILLLIPKGRRRALRRQLNGIATSYYSKVAHWSKTQKITIDMV